MEQTQEANICCIYASRGASQYTFSICKILTFVPLPWQSNLSSLYLIPRILQLLISEKCTDPWQYTTNQARERKPRKGIERKIVFFPLFFFFSSATRSRLSVLEFSVFWLRTLFSSLLLITV